MADNCKDVFTRLSEYLDAELTPESYERIKQHLAGCPPCIEFLESLKRSIKLCKECEHEQRPGPLSEAAKQQLLAAYRRSVASRKG